MAAEKPLGPTELKRLHRDWRRRTELRMAMILDGVQNPYNIGSILRSAAAYRLETVWLAPPTLPVTHAKVAKTALGCERLVETRVTESTEQALALAGAAGFTTVAVELSASARPLFDLDLSGPVCLVMGHEERGVHRDTLAAVDQVGFLPQVGKVGSLNVAQAATTAIYEIARQAWTSAGGD
ncbi:MAG: TrmH family RNA methyltransferase [Acidimicrobiales bacterium]